MPAKKSKKPITDKFKLKENLQGKNKFVAFIDVMGFSNLVYKSSGSAEALDSYFSKITDEIDDIRSSTLGDKLQSFLISDSIILIAPEGLDGLRLVINTVRRIQSALLWRKILLRGAISFGEVFYDPKHNIIVGKAFIKAYKLEHEANYPRVIIDPSIIKKVGSDKTAFLKAVNGSLEYNFEHREIYVPSGFSKIAEDGIFVDYATKTVREKDLNENIKRVYEVIVENLYIEQSLFQKYVWLRDYFTESLKYTSSFIPEMAGPHSPYKKILKDWTEKFERL